MPVLLLQRVFGTSDVQYDPGAKGEEYNHNDWLKSILPPAPDTQDSDDDGAEQCFVKATLQRNAIGAQRDADWTCDGDSRLVGELFCLRCLDHLD